MRLVYDYIQKQKQDLVNQYSHDTSLFSLLSKLLSNDGTEIIFKSHSDFSLTKMTYALDGLTILKQDKYDEIFSMQEMDNLYAIYQRSLTNVLDSENVIHSTKILSFFSHMLNKDLIDRLTDYLRNYQFNMDYIFERNASVVICDVVELLISLRKNFYSDERKVNNLIVSYIEILIGEMKAVGFNQNQHSFFLDKSNQSIDAIYWQDGDIRKSIVLLREGFYNNYPKFFETGLLISHHVLLISSISKVESDKFGTNVGILGLICGFKQLYELTSDEIFKKEGERWTEILEKSLIKLAERNQQVNIKTLIDISLAYKYLTFTIWRQSENLFQN